MEMYVLRNLVMRYGAQEGLKPNQKEFIWHILDFDHDGKKFSWPSLTTVGKRMGLQAGGVRKIAKSLSRKRLIKIIDVQGKSNRYNYENLIKRFKPYWEAEAKNGSFLDKTNPSTFVEGSKNNIKNPSTFVEDTPLLLDTPPLHKSIGHPSTFVHMNTLINTENNTSIEHSAPQSGASMRAPSESPGAGKPNLSNFEKLIDWWYECKGEPNPGTPPPRHDRKKFTEIVADRLSDGRNWRQLSSAVLNYWTVVKSPKYYYTHRANIAKFFAETVDQFWDEENPLQNFLADKNGKHGISATSVSPSYHQLYKTPDYLKTPANA